mgnify:CR=1 FL=1
MKKFTIVTAILFLLTNILNAQTEQGKILVSGKSSLDFTSSTTKYYYDGETDSDFDEKVNKFSIAPSVGYFVIDNLAVGLSASYQTEKYKEGSDNWDDPISVYMVGPFVTYIFPLQGMVKPFIGGIGGIAGASYGPDDEDKQSGVIYGGNAGVALFLNKNISLDLGGQYIKSNFRNNGDNKYQSKSGNFAATVGFSLFF